MTEQTDHSARFVLPESSPLVGNLGALWANDPTLARVIEGEIERPLDTVEASKSGLPTLWRPLGTSRQYLHSRHQPQDEARRLIDTLDVSSVGVFCVFGFGLGYAVEELFARTGKEAVIVVMEPDVKLLATAMSCRDLSQMIRSNRLIFITQMDRAAILLRLSARQALVSVGVGYVEHGPSVKLQPEFHRQMRVWMDEFVEYCKTNINTLILNGRRTLENISRNIGWYAAAGGIGRLKNRHARKPAIIVSAGPSLRKNQHLLKEAQGKAVLVSVQTTLQPLLEMGLEPDFVTSLDYHSISTRFYEKLPKTLRTELVAEPKASSAILSMYPGPVSLLGNEAADLLLSPMPLDRPRLKAGATVAHLAFYLAQHLGCDPIIFVGQDLGFSDGLAYAPGTSYEDVWRPELSRFCTIEMKQWEHIARDRPILRRIEDQQGGAMYTEERLFTYLQQFERDFAEAKARVIDATEGGALKRGAVRMTLRAALEQFCRDELPAAKQDHPGYRWESAAACVERLNERRGEAGQIGEIAEKTLALLLRVQANLNDLRLVNTLIAQIDSLRAEMRRYDDCYELVTQLTQETELARFRQDRLLAASKLPAEERQKRQLERDIANVRGVIGAAGEFAKLMDEVIARLGRIPQVGAAGRAA